MLSKGEDSGLFLAKEIATSHNGTIRCQSSGGKIEMIVDFRWLRWVKRRTQSSGRLNEVVGQCLDGQWRIPLAAVIHQYIGPPAFSDRLLH